MAIEAEEVSRILAAQLPAAFEERLEREAVAVAVEGDAEIRTVLDHRTRHRLRRCRAACLVDVDAVGLAAHRYDLRAQLLEDAQADSIVGAMRAIDHELQPAKRALLRE